MDIHRQDLELHFSSNTPHCFTKLLINITAINKTLCTSQMIPLSKYYISCQLLEQIIIIFGSRMSNGHFDL